LVARSFVTSETPACFKPCFWDCLWFKILSNAVELWIYTIIL